MPEGVSNAEQAGALHGAGAAPQPSLDTDVAACRRDFDQAMATRDVDAAVTAILDLDEVIASWAADTLQSDASDRARRELRAMVVRLGDLARVGAADPRTLLAPVVDAVLAERTAAKAGRDFALSDRLRDALAAGGVSVQDTSEGVRWSLQPLDDEAPGPAR